jgi:hypothetical protein
MFQRGGAVATFRLPHLVGLPAAFDREHGQVLAPVGEQQSIPDGNGGVVGVEDDGQAEQQVTGGAMTLHHRVVILLVHEAAQGGEAAHHQQLHVAGIAIAALHHPVHPGPHRLGLVGGCHQIHQGAAVGWDETGPCLCVVIDGGGISDRHGTRRMGRNEWNSPRPWPWNSEEQPMGTECRNNRAVGSKRVQGTKKGP